MKESKIKKKFRVCVDLPLVNIIFLLIPGCFFLVLMIISSAPLSAIIFGIILLLIFPLMFLVWLTIEYWPIIEFDENGLQKTLFGKYFKRNILWEEIADIKIFNAGIVQWIYFSKSSLMGERHARCRRRKDNIYLLYTKKLKETLKHIKGIEINKQGLM